MKVSILIPTFNRVTYLKEAIDSALRQSYSNIEIIVSDNFSTDETPVLLSQYEQYENVRCYRNSINLGMVGNWRKMLYDYVEGDFFIMLSDDDVLLDNDYVAKAVSLIQKDSGIKMVYANGIVRYESINQDVGLNLPFDSVTDGRDILMSRGTVKPVDFMLCNVLFNTELARELNSFNNPNNLSCDSELFFKSAVIGDIGVVNSYASLYRIHDNNLVLKIVKDFDLFINNWEYVSNTLPLMAEYNFYNEQEKEAFYQRVVRPMISFNVFNAYMYHLERLEEVLQKLEKDFGTQIWQRYKSGRAISLISKLPPRLGRVIVKILLGLPPIISFFQKKHQ